MRARAVTTSMDTESLQADVMRFMAIIAFCLIAILALVRNIEAPADSAQQPVRPAPVVPQAKAQVEAPEAVIEAAVSSQREAAPAPASILEPVPAQQAPVVPRSLPLPEPRPVVKEQVPVEPLVESPVQREAGGVPVPADDAGLSLRFATEQDFLRLIARGEVQVFVFKPGEVRKLGTGYRFQLAPAPGELFEMLPETIPTLVRNSAAQAVGGLTAYQFGVQFPARIERRIASLVDSVSAGELLIDRFGQVTHVAESRD